MSEPEFRRWSSIERFSQMITITEKIHGSNAQIFVDDSGEVHAGSRERWLTLVHDNFGFCNHVKTHADEIRTLLGPGRHFGEWYGSGINSTYGLKTKRLALFDTRWQDKPRPDWCDVVPILYQGLHSAEAVATTLAKLKQEGSVLQPGFMAPEGIVLRFERSGVLMKQVFDAEETAWKGHTRGMDEKSAERNERRKMLEDLGRAYLQPLRLEKLLSRDSEFRVGYPKTLPGIVKAYVADLEKETDDLNKDAWEAARKMLFSFVKAEIEK